MQNYVKRGAETMSKGARATSRDLLLEFWDPLYISGTDNDRNFKFGVRIDRWATNQKAAKVGQKGRGLRHVTFFLNFGTPSIFLEWVQLETSNLVCRLCRLTAMIKNQEMQK